MRKKEHLVKYSGMIVRCRKFFGFLRAKSYNSECFLVQSCDFRHFPANFGYNRMIEEDIWLCSDTIVWFRKIPVVFELDREIPEDIRLDSGMIVWFRKIFGCFRVWSCDFGRYSVVFGYDRVITENIRLFLGIIVQFCKNLALFERDREIREDLSLISGIMVRSLKMPLPIRFFRVAFRPSQSLYLKGKFTQMKLQSKSRLISSTPLTQPHPHHYFSPQDGNPIWKPCQSNSYLNNTQFP